MTRPSEEWRRDIYRRYAALSKLTQEHAKLQFLRILRAFPYGNSVFFSVKRSEDPIGLLPSKLILGINKRGVHFFRPVPKEYLHSAELRDIMQYGSSSQAVFFKTRVAGVLHVFQFETRQGEDICMALQTHISDIMMKRYAKAKDNRRSSHTAAIAQPNFGAKYDQHLSKKKLEVEEAQRQVEELEQKGRDADYKIQELRSELERFRQNATGSESTKSELQADANAMQKAIISAKEELNELKNVRQFVFSTKKELRWRFSFVENCGNRGPSGLGSD